MMPRKLPEQRRGGTATSYGRRLSHSSLARPSALFVDELPEGAQLYQGNTPWRRVCDMLVRAWGNRKWLALEYEYTSAHSPTDTARRTLEAGEYPTEAAKALEVASVATEQEGRVRVFLRLDPDKMMSEKDAGDDDDA